MYVPSFHINVVTFWETNGVGRALWPPCIKGRILAPKNPHETKYF